MAERSAQVDGVVLEAAESLLFPTEGSRRGLALAAAARTGKIGDGKIFVYEVAEAIRIRNDDRGDSAL